MLAVTVKNNGLFFGDRLFLSFQRTLRLPDDGNTYPLPPGLGEFPLCKVDDYCDRVPESWKEHGGVFLPMYQREALWIYFRGASWKPNAVKIAVGKINAVTGKAWHQTLNSHEQDYLVCPPQPWLDGINSGNGYIRQFVAMPLRMGYTIEGQITGEEEFGGIQILVLDPKPGRFPDEPPPEPQRRGMTFMAPMAPSSEKARACTVEMGLAAGGKMKQKIYPDPYGANTWDETNFGRLYIHIVNSMMYQEITGQEPPKTPITAKMYQQSGLPWFDLYDENKGDVKASSILSQVKSVKEMDLGKGLESQSDDASVSVPEAQIKKLKLEGDRVRDGNW